MDGIKIVTLNCNGLRIPSKRRALFKKFRSLKADFILLQETHSTQNDENIWLTEWGGGGCFSHGRSNSRGVGILFQRNNTYSINTTFKDTDGRFVIIQVTKEGKHITLVNIYAPTSSEQANQLSVLNDIIRTLANMEIQNLLVAGDMNINLDETMTSSTRNAYAEQINHLLDEYNLVDVWKKKNPNSKRGTFHRNKFSSRLDYIFAPAHLLTSISSINIHPEPLSDHCSVFMEASISTPTRGPGFWKFDNQLLTDDTFMEKMTTNIRQSLTEDFDDPNLLWEWTKFKIKEFCISYTTQRRREVNKTTDALEKRLLHLAEKYNLTETEDIVMEVQSIKRELAEIQQAKATKTIFRAKAKWMCLGEKPSAYFLGLQKRLSNDKCISALKDENGHTLTDAADILAYENRYFSGIYREDPSHLAPLEDFPLSTEDLPQVTASHKYLINLPFTPRDFHEALKELNKNKTPGSDGITPEFYLAFWDVLQNPFYESIMHSIERGLLSQEQRTGIVTLIPKKSQDRLLLSNWRPITLLNSDFKIFSKALAIRLQSCIKDVLCEDQTGFVKGRTIGMNLTNIQMIIDQTNASHSNGLLLAVDYRKAFDTVRWDLIFYALQSFGFGEYILKAIKTLFNDIKTCVLNYGFSSDYFKPERGIRQGCCCSPSLFILAVELLAVMVRKAMQIKGLNLAGQEKKISQYADDASFFLQDFQSLDRLLQLLAEFASFSGLQINHHKSYLLMLGHHLDPPQQYKNIRIDDKVTILGITFQNMRSEKQHYDLNFAPRLEKIRKICTSWTNRNLSMKGKVVLISSLMASILQFPCSSTPTPTRVIVDFKKIITDFFWNNKRGKVAYNLLVQDIKEGGMKLPDLSTRIQVAQLYWIKRMWKQPDSMMANFLTHALGFDDIRNLIATKTNMVTRIHGEHTFIRQILTTWNKLHTHQPKNEQEIQQEIIWENDFIRINMKPFTWHQWKNAGVLHINDLLHSTEPRFLSHTEIAEKYGITASFLQLLQIRSAIPISWKRKIVNPATQDLQVKPTILTDNDSSTTIIGKTSKVLYYALIKSMKPSVTSQRRWNEIFPIDPDNAEEFWANVYQSPYKAARDTKLHAFHFRVVHRFIPCNSFLKNIRIKRDDQCSYCPAADSIQHFLFTCPVVQTFWKQVVSWFSKETRIQLNVSLRSFLFGIPMEVPQAKVINFILLFTKFFIYRQKLFHQASMEITHFLKELRQRLRIEEFITSQDNKRFLFAKWQGILSALT